MAGDDKLQMRLLIVEDDAKLLRALARGLRQEGYEVDVTQDGEEALSLATDTEYDAVVLDLMLPALDGFAVCESLRRRERWMPVLMLTARTSVGDRIRGLDAGADDYLVKPFDFGELLARLRALLRRAPAERGGIVTIGDLRLDSATRVVTQAGIEVELTAREFEFLEFVETRHCDVVSRAELLEQVWDGHYDGSPNIIDVYVGYLRRKLGRDVIRTVRGSGFVLESR